MNIQAQRRILEAQTSRAMSEGYVTVVNICCLGAGRTQWVSMGSFKAGVLCEVGGLKGAVSYRA